MGGIAIGGIAVGFLPQPAALAPTWVPCAAATIFPAESFCTFQGVFAGFTYQGLTS
jgi:hypothetical protein